MGFSVPPQGHRAPSSGTWYPGEPSPFSQTKGISCQDYLCPHPIALSLSRAPGSGAPSCGCHKSSVCARVCVSVFVCVRMHTTTSM